MSVLRALPAAHLAAALLLAALLVPGIPPEPAHGSSHDFLVDDAGDAIDGDIGDGFCDTDPTPPLPDVPDGTPCTLRAALQEAANLATPDGSPWVIAVDAPVVASGIILSTELVAGAGAVNNPARLEGGGVVVSQTTAGERVMAVVDTSLTIIETTFTGGAVPAPGGAVDAPVNAGHTLQFDRVVFDDNASGADGGGLHVVGGVVDVVASRFGSAVIGLGGNDAGGSGGAISCDGCVLDVSGTDFNENHATVSGGAIHLTGGASATIHGGTSIARNTTDDDGGGIWLGAADSVHVTGSRVVDNAAGVAAGTHHGGGIAVAGGTVTGDLSEISGNSAIAFGGGIYAADTSTVDISDSTIALNSASEGGGIYARGTTLSLSAAPTGSMDVLDNAATSGRGGGMSLVGASPVPPASLVRVTVGGNSAAYGGGISVASPAELAMSGGTITMNTALAGSGGGVAAESAVVALTDVAVVDNTASGHGGGLEAFTGGDVTLVRGSVADNTAGDHGGGVHSEADSLVIDGTAVVFNAAANGGGVHHDASSSTLDITGATLSDNDASGDGGALWLGSDVTASLVGSTLERNAAAGVGGAVRTVSRMDISTTTLRDNDSGSHGGGLHVASHNGTSTLVDSTITGNRAGADDTGPDAGGSGGGVYLASVDLAVTRSTVSDNTACDGTTANGCPGGGTLTDAWGGGLYVGSITLGTVTLTDSTVVGNRARTGGGLYAAASDALDLTTSSVRSNVASEDGGGIYVAGSLVTDGSAIDDNVAGGDGGGLYQASGTSTLTSTTLDRNAAGGTTPNDAENGDGGGVYVAAGFLSAHSAGASISDNTADGTGAVPGLGYGGGLYLAANNVDAELFGVLVDGNDAEEGGGAWVGDTSLLTLGSTFDGQTLVTGNTATIGGGGLYVDGGSVNASGIEISGNSAPEGGGIWASTPGAFVWLASSELQDNSATGLPGDGAGAWIGGGALFEVDQSTISGNVAANWGGGVYLGLGATANLSETAVLENSAADGGGVWLGLDDALDAQNVTFSGNAATDEGGAMWNAGTTRLNFVTIADNTSVGVGAGVYSGVGGTVTVSRSVLARNVQGLATDSNCATVSGTISSGGYNVADDTTCSFAGTGDQQVGDAGLLALANNGGPTRTHALEGSSPAVDAVSPGACVDLDGFSAMNNDQRFATRPADGDEDATADCDAGAFELNEGVFVGLTSDGDERGPIDGLVRISRVGDTSLATDVGFTIGGTAGSGDHTLRDAAGGIVTSPVTIPAGDSFFDIIVDVVDDSLVEGDETVVLTLTPPGSTEYSLLDPAAGTVTIRDDDSTATVSASAAAAAEEGPVDGEFTISRGGDTRGNLVINLSVGGTATPGKDYAALPTAVTIPDGATSATVTVDVTDDRKPEAAETVELTVVAGGYAVGGAKATVTIADNDGVAEFEQVKGNTRIQTAIETSKRHHADGSMPIVILTRSDAFPDSLAGGPLAAHLGSPVLLTTSAELHPDVKAEIERLGAKTVYILGGTVAVTPAVETGLAAAGVTEIVRLAGASRFETAIDIATFLAEWIEMERTASGRTSADRSARAATATHVYVAEGINPNPARGWPDPMAISYLAGFQERPILLTQAESLNSATKQALIDLGVTNVTIVGGTFSVSQAVEDEIVGMGITVDRVSGLDRYDTSAKIADLALAAGMEADVVWLTTGLNYPDGLSGAPGVVLDNGILLLVNGQDLSASKATEAWLQAHHTEIGLVRYLGGDAAISPSVRSAVQAIVEP